MQLPNINSSDFTEIALTKISSYFITSYKLKLHYCINFIKIICFKGVKSKLIFTKSFATVTDF